MLRRRSFEMFEHVLLQLGRFFDPVVALESIEFFRLPLAQFGDIAFIADQVRGQKHEQIQFLCRLALKPEEPPEPRYVPEERHFALANGEVVPNEASHHDGLVVPCYCCGFH